MTPQTDSVVWYALYTMPKVEKKVHHALSEKGIRAFLPLVPRVVQWSDRKKKLLCPLFPNYVFANVVSPQQKKEIYNTPGFVRFISTTGKPDVIPDYEIRIIRQLLEGSPTVSLHHFEVGEEVEIVRGHFKGICGTLIKRNGSNKLVIHLNNIRQSLLVEICPSLVAKTSKLILPSSVGSE